MRTSVTAFLLLFGLMVSLVAISMVDSKIKQQNDRENMRRFAYTREEHGRKILFNSHTLDTEQAPNAQNRVNSYSIHGLSEMAKNALFRPSSDPTVFQIFLVHFKPEIVLTQELKLSFSQTTGIELGSYMPHNAFAVVCTQAQIEKALAFPAVSWAGDFPPEAKIYGPLLDYRLGDIASFPESAGLASGFALDVRLAPIAGRLTDDLQRIVTTFQAAMGEIVKGVVVSPIANPKNNRILIKRVGASTEKEVEALVDYLIKQVDVLGVQLALHKKAVNQFAQWITQSNSPSAVAVGPTSDPGRTIWQRGIRGDNQIIGVADSGLDYDHCFFKTVGMTPTSTVNNAMRKVLAYQSLADFGDDVDGHGTHVCGTVLGQANTADGYAAVLNQHSGLAPNAKLLFSDIETTGSDHFDGLDGVDFPSQVLSWAYQNGARIHTNSWGTTDNTYDSDAASLDDFLFNHPDLVVTVAAGNSGGTQNVATNTVGSPSTAKNVICVAAGNTATPGMVDSLRFVDWNAKEISARQQLKDPSLICCNSPRDDVKTYCCYDYRRQNVLDNSDIYNQNNLAYFSSRGPTKDGRFKPDVVGIGQSIVSSRSDGCNSFGCPDICAGNYNNQTVFITKDGTSMATPGVAGSVALIRQYLTEGWYPTGTKTPGNAINTPIASLIGAMLMNSGRSLTGNVDLYNTGVQYVDLSNGVYPLDVYQGFGRIELDNVLYFPSSTFNLYLTQDISLSSGQDYDVEFTALAAGVLRVNMGYRDPAGSASASYVTVNDIDLYVGLNYLNGSNAYAGNFQTKRDSRNNNEGVQYFVNPGDVIYIKVRGVNVPVPPQQVALVITGPFDPNSRSVLPTGQFSVPMFSEFNPATEDSSSSTSGRTAGIVVGIIVLICIAVVIWYFMVYVPGNRRRAAAAKQRYDAQHGTAQQQPQTGVPVGIPMHAPPPVYGQPVGQPMYTNQGGIG